MNAVPGARGTNRFVWLLLLACALLLLPALGSYPLFDVDEGAFSEATRELLRSGDWLSTTLNGVARYDKPILIYWLQAVSVAGLGLNEFALRLPSALAGLAWIALIARFAMPRLGIANGLLAGWIAASSLGVLAISRAATADALLNALLAALMFDLWRHLEGGGRAPLRRAYLWMALGLLTKGPIAVLIPFAVSLGYCLLARRWRDWARAAFDLPGWLVVLAVAGPWYAYQLAVHGREFVDGFLVRHNLDRFGGTLEGHGGGIGYYVLWFPLLLLPWTGLLAAGVRRARTDWREPLARYLMLWFGFVFVFFSLSGTKLPHYLLYGMTPVFLLLARRVRDCSGFVNALLLPCLVVVLVPALPALLAWSSDLLAANPHAAFYVALVRRPEALPPAAYYVFSGAGAAAALAVSAYRPWPVWQRAVAATGALSAVIGFVLAPWLGGVLCAPVKHAAQLAASLPGTAVQWEIAAPSFSVYRQQITPSRPPGPGELAIIRTDRIAPDASLEMLFREADVALVRRRGVAPGPLLEGRRSQ